MTQQRTYPQGVTSWVDIEQRDVDGALAFYGAVLGWTFHQASPPGAPRYVIAQVDGLDVAGVGEGAEDPGWHTYVAVDDVEAVLDRITAAGGAVTTGPTVAGEGGTWAGFTDPQGAPLRLWQPKRRLGAQIVNAPGAWNFSDLRSDDPATAFYTQVFGWEFADLGFGTMIRVPGYGDHLAATTDPDIRERQAAVSVPPGSRTRSAGSHPRSRTRPRTGTRRSPSPTGTRPRRWPPSRAARSWSARTRRGRSRRRSGTRRGRCSPGASSRPRRSEPNPPGRRGT